MRVTKRCPQCNEKIKVPGNCFIAVNCPSCHARLYVDHGAFTDASASDQSKGKGSDKNFTSQAWLLIGLFNSVPGILKLHQGTLSFTAVGSGTLWKRGLRKLEKKTGIKNLAQNLFEEGSAELFKLPATEIDRVSFPLIYFSAGMHLHFKGLRFRFSFIRPNNAQMPELNAGGRVFKSLRNLNELGPARAVGEQWKELLEVKD